MTLSQTLIPQNSLPGGFFKLPVDRNLKLGFVHKKYESLFIK